MKKQKSTLSTKKHTHTIDKNNLKQDSSQNKKTETKAEGHKYNINHEKVNLILYFIGLACYIIALFLTSHVAVLVLSILTVVLSGYHVIVEGFADTIKKTIKHKKFMPNVHILMSLASLGSFFIGSATEGALLIIIFAGAHYLEEFTENKSKKEITSLLKLNPTTARLLKDGLNYEIVDVKTLKVGDRVLVLNGDQIPTDGTVESGDSSVNQSTITGESMPVDKKKGDFVYGSTLNGEGVLVVTVTKDSSSTVFAKISQLVTEAQNNVSKTEIFIRKFEPIYVTAVLIFAPIFFLLGAYVLPWGIETSFYRSMVLLIVASPCALAATALPATLSALSNLAKKGVLFKGGSFLSNLADVKAVAFDKTGTLTKGKPEVTDVIFTKELEAKQEQNFINIIVGMERQSNHPLATAIVNNFKVDKALNIEAKNIVGVGLIATYKKQKYKIAKPTAFENLNAETKLKITQLEMQGKTVVVFSHNSNIACLIALQDIPKQTSKDAIKYLNQQNIHTVMLTGDATQTGNAIGSELGISQIIAEVLPEDKAKLIKELKKKYGIVAMIGDGVNDAPALAVADIGIAMGGGTALAIDVADAVLMQNNLSKVVDAHKVSKKLKTVVMQNIVISMAVIFTLITLNIFGLMNMGWAVALHEGSTIIVTLNGLRLLGGFSKKS